MARGKGCDSSRRPSPCCVCSAGLPSLSRRLVFVLWVSEPTSPGGGRGEQGERGVSNVFVCSLLSLGPRAPGVTLGETLGWPPGPSPAPAQCDPLFPHELCPCQTVPDFQETRPRNYILSASASAVSAPTPPHPWPPPAPPTPRGLWHSKQEAGEGRATAHPVRPVPKGSVYLPVPCPCARPCFSL